MSEELEKLKRKLQSYETSRTLVLASTVLALSGDVVVDTEAAIDHMSRSRTVDAAGKRYPAIIISSRKLPTSAIPEPHRDGVIGSLNFRRSEDSDEAIIVVEHRAIVTGISSFIDPNNVVKELCPVIYEIFVEDQETSLMAQDRVVDVIMIGDNYGIIEGTSSSELNYEDPKKPPKPKKGGPKSKQKFGAKGAIVKPLKSR